MTRKIDQSRAGTRAENDKMEYLASRQYASAPADFGVFDNRCRHTISAAGAVEAIISVHARTSADSTTSITIFGSRDPLRRVRTSTRRAVTAGDVENRSDSEARMISLIRSAKRLAADSMCNESPGRRANSASATCQARGDAAVGVFTIADAKHKTLSITEKRNRSATITR